jgi:hypothetical protein
MLLLSNRGSIEEEQHLEEAENHRGEKPISKHRHSSSDGGKGKREVPCDVREFLAFFCVNFST